MCIQIDHLLHSDTFVVGENNSNDHPGSQKWGGFCEETQPFGDPQKYLTLDLHTGLVLKPSLQNCYIFSKTGHNCWAMWEFDQSGQSGPLLSDRKTGHHF